MTIQVKAQHSSMARRVRRVKSEIHRLKRIGTPLRTATRKYLETLGFVYGAKYSPAEFKVTLDSLREQAFLASNPSDFGVLYHMSETLSKWEGGKALHLGVDREDRVTVGYNRFWDAEDSCREANYRLRDTPFGEHKAWPLLARAASLIEGVLGPCDLEELPNACKFGPGATTSLKAADSSLQSKWQNARHITKKALPYWHAYILHNPGAAHIKSWSAEVVEGNMLAPVPKDWEKERIIAIEPDWNMFFQLGLGRMIRRRLNRIGLLLKDAQESQGVSAWIGSKYGSLATLDLKAASDTLCYELVRVLLPRDWWTHLQATRSEYGEIGGASYRYQKFSSMGNGYTFELETLIFWALSVAVTEKNQRDDVSVYGDDIIVPSSSVPALTELLTFCGLTLNMKKSFWGDHPFRESCGWHFFQGVDVTPFYLRHDVESCGDLIVLANHCLGASRSICDSFKIVWDHAYRVLPPELRGPEECDGALHTPWDRACPIYEKDLQAFWYCTITRERMFYDVWTWSGSYLFKLWLNQPKERDVLEQAAETSWLGRAGSKEVLGTSYIDRCAWE